MKRKNKINFLIIIIIVFLLIIGTSYAYWRFTYIGNQTNIGKSKCLSIDLTNQKNEINLTNTYPISDEAGKKLTPYSFTVTNTCDTFISYNVNLEMLEGTTMNSKYMAVMVNNEKKELLSNLEEASTAISSSTESRKLASGSLGSGDSVDYTLRLWMDESVSINDDAMNKVFTSKIVVTAEPSNYTPKDAGYDTLHDAILANEYQTTPEIAKEKIAAKGTPDLSNTAPIIKWIEKIGESALKEVVKPAESVIETYNKDTGTGDRTTQASDLTINDTKLKLYKTKTFNSDTAKYTLSNPVYIDPTTIDYSSDTKYYFKDESIYYDYAKKKLITASENNDVMIYQITGATKVSSKTTWNNVEYESITYKLDLLTLSEMELESDKSDKGLYKAEDDYGTTYYYRGNVKNNNVYFAGYYWQIIRINGDNSIRIMYNGPEKNATDLNQIINNQVSQFNYLFKDPTYVGYMYGDPDGQTFDEVHNNINDSTIKTIIDNWYETNIKDKGYNNYLADFSGFCGDRSLPTSIFSENDNGDGITSAQKTSYFSPYLRYLKNTAQFTCPNTSRDLYTTKNSSIGNNALTYPIGLITYDELVYAGLDSKHINKLSYAYSSQSYWTMSPSFFSAANVFAYEWFLLNTGYLSRGYITAQNGIRPVINLKADVKITGGIGTTNDPYIIDTNN